MGLDLDGLHDVVRSAAGCKLMQKPQTLLAVRKRILGLARSSRKAFLRALASCYSLRRILGQLSNGFVFEESGGVPGDTQFFPGCERQVDRADGIEPEAR